jgi:Sds3-like
MKAHSTFSAITTNFHHDRETAFLHLLNQIQHRLAQLYDGSDDEFLAQVAVLEDLRDRDLIQVEAARGFALERIEREYEEEKRLAEKEFQV